MTDINPLDEGQRAAAQRRGWWRRPSGRRLLRAAGLVAVIAALVAAGGGLWVCVQLRGSLPVLEGQQALAGLSAAVTVDRDELGIPAIRGASRQDVARATGFLHAQERFFQMDLARRRAAGELSALVGGRALAADREVRIHRFRPQARRAVSLLTPSNRSALDAYTAGVNAGLAALQSPPFEYLLLGETPDPWRPEDTFLVVLSMFVTLQDTDGSDEAALAVMFDVLPRPMAEFLAPAGTEWDAPVLGPEFEIPPIPGPDVYDLRARERARTRIDQPADGGASAPAPETRNAIGSNSWVVSGAHTADGDPLVANDMHLDVRVPNTWYRALLEWPDPSEPSGTRRVVGVTLPGVPAVVVGSNGHVAWGFTNTYADWSDIVLLEVDAADPERYRTPAGWREFERHEEVIEIAGGDPVREIVRWTIWGPVLEPDHKDRARAYRWVAHSAERLAMNVTPFENARTVEEVFGDANGMGAPGQNVVTADRDGAIGWTVYGAIPRRVGLSGMLPESWADGSRGWDGWVTPAEYPRIVNPPSGRLWTANARVVDGEMLAKLGDGGYEVGSRATIIRDRLLARSGFSAADMLDLQLETSATFVERWRELALRTLTPAALEGHAGRAAFRHVLETTWTGHASPGSAAYTLTRAFRAGVSGAVSRFLLREVSRAGGFFVQARLRRIEGPVWALVTQKPMHLLPPAYDSWDDLFLSVIDDFIEEPWRPSNLEERVWSLDNVMRYRHPLSSSIPLAGRWLDMPYTPIPGDLFTPRMQSGAAAASMRMVVSPGREEDGLMHMPAGQSGHPLSPFYANSHPAWVEGAATPLMPGPIRYQLTLHPVRRDVQ